MELNSRSLIFEQPYCKPYCKSIYDFYVQCPAIWQQPV